MKENQKDQPVTDNPNDQKIQGSPNIKDNPIKSNSTSQDPAAIVVDDEKKTEAPSVIVNIFNNDEVKGSEKKTSEVVGNKSAVVDDENKTNAQTSYQAGFKGFTPVDNAKLNHFDDIVVDAKNADAKLSDNYFNMRIKGVDNEKNIAVQPSHPFQMFVEQPVVDNVKTNAEASQETSTVVKADDVTTGGKELDDKEEKP